MAGAGEQGHAVGTLPQPVRRNFSDISNAEALRRAREIVPILRERLQRTREEELATAVDELVQIAIDRWQTS